MRPLLNKRLTSKDVIFLKDLALCHTSKEMDEYFARNKVAVLEWLGNSADLNPLRILWAICKQRFAKMDFRMHKITSLFIQ